MSAYAVKMIANDCICNHSELYLFNPNSIIATLTRKVSETKARYPKGNFGPTLCAHSPLIG